MNTADSQTLTAIIVPSRVSTKPDSPDRETHRPGPVGGTKSRSTDKPQDLLSSQGSIETARSFGVVPIKPVHAPGNVPVISRVTSIYGVGPISKAANDPDAYAIGTSIRLTVGGPAATIAGTVYTALPSGSVVFTIANKPDTLLPYIASVFLARVCTTTASKQHIF